MQIVGTHTGNFVESVKGPYKDIHNDGIMIF